MSGVDVATIKTAIHSWVVLASGLAGDHAVWMPLRDSRGNPVPRPSGMYAAMSIMGLRNPGFDDNNSYTVSGSSGSSTAFDDAAFDSGSFAADDPVMSQTIQGPRILLLSLEVFQGSPTGGSDTDPLSLLNDILSASQRDDIDQILTAAHLAIGTFTDPQHVPQPYNEAKQELRAFSTVKLHTRSRLVFTQSTPNTGWIDTVNAAATITTDTGTEHITISATNP